MADKYKRYKNSINDFFLDMIITGVDVCDPENKKDIVEGCKYYFINLLDEITKI